jgi:hypothetical protein
VLISRENIIVFGEDLKLGINLRKTIVIEYYNNRFIRSLSRDFFPSRRKGFQCISVFLCVIDILVID